MNSILVGLLKIGLDAFAKLVNKFFDSRRGKKVKSIMSDAAIIVAVVAARTDTKIDDTIAEVLKELELSDDPGTVLSGKLGNIIRREVARRLLTQRTGATDSEANLAIELALGQAKG